MKSNRLSTEPIQMYYKIKPYIFLYIWGPDAHRDKRPCQGFLTEMTFCLNVDIRETKGCQSISQREKMCVLKLELNANANTKI